MKNLLLIIGLIASGSASALYQINPDYYAVEELYLEKGKTYVVPTCRKLLLQDINLLSDGSWVEVEGVVQIAEGYNFENATSHYLNGRFTFSTRNGLPMHHVILYPESKVTLLGSGKTERLPANKFQWIGDGCGGAK